MQSGIELVPAREAETLPMVISLSLSTGGVSFVPAYMERLMPPSVVGRPLHGKAPTITLALGYSRSNVSPLLKHFLSKADDLAVDAVAGSKPSSGSHGQGLGLARS